MNLRLLVALSLFSNGVLATDLGVIGTVYPIKEKNLIEHIRDKLVQKEQSGELVQLHGKLKDQAVAYAKRPGGISIPRAGAYRALEINPTYTLDRDITDADGNVLFKAGTQVNPLDIRPLTKALCFVDGDDKEQLEWVRRHCTANTRNKIILVNGDIEVAGKYLQRRVYFDQQASLVAKFQIQALPAVIRQSGKVIYVEEFPVK